MSEGKFCKGCEHERGSIYSFCYRPTSEINPVTGHPFIVGEECRSERKATWWPWSKRCGPEGRHWKPKVIAEKPGKSKP